MMNNPETRISRARRLTGHIRAWLDGTDGSLAEAMARSESEGLFPAEDIRFAVEQIRAQVDDNQLEKWAGETGDITLPQKETVLCLHAGNLPLVGFQDLVAVMLSGHRYLGKISRKDPWLLPSLQEILKADPEFDVAWSTDLDAFQNKKADRVMFSGSESSAPVVRTRLAEDGISGPETRFLIRTAHSSAAWIAGKDFEGEDEEKEKALAGMLADSVFRYQGKGCRTLTTIFTDGDTERLFGMMEEVKNRFAYCKDITLKKKSSPLLRFKKAFFSSVGAQSLLIGDRLIAEAEPDLHTEGMVTITKAKPDELRNFVNRNRAHIQSVYAAGNPEISEINFEPLARAQRPPLNWTPDGTDPLKWLLSAGT